MRERSYGEEVVEKAMKLRREEGVTREEKERTEEQHVTSRGRKKELKIPPLVRVIPGAVATSHDSAGAKEVTSAKEVGGVDSDCTRKNTADDLTTNITRIAAKLVVDL